MAATRSAVCTPARGPGALPRLQLDAAREHPVSLDRESSVRRLLGAQSGERALGATASGDRDAVVLPALGGRKQQELGPADRGLLVLSWDLAPGTVGGRRERGVRRRRRHLDL